MFIGKIDLSGLSASQMVQLIKEPLGDNSILKINEVEDDIFNKIPFFQTVEHLLLMVLQAGSIKLTPKGNLPIKVCEDISNQQYWKEELAYLYKQRKEEDYQVIHTAKIISLIGGLARKANGKMNVTKQTQKTLEKNDKNALFLSILKPFMLKFNWGYHDLYESQHVGQTGWAFTLYMLHKYGQESHPTSFYAEKYLNAFPPVVNEFRDRTYSTPEQQAMSCYIVRSFIRYFNWMGFVELPKEIRILDYENEIMHKTDVLDALFSFKIN